jgi:hypothetical protein
LSKARGRGLSVIDATSPALSGKLDPSAIAEARLDLAERYAERRSRSQGRLLRA